MQQQFTRAVLAAAVLAALAACGGGGGGAAPENPPSAGAPTPSAASAGTLATPPAAAQQPAAATAPAPAVAAAPAAAAPVASAQPPAAPPDFVLHANSQGAQDSGSVVTLAGGGHVAVWASGSGSADRHVRLQRFDAAGARIGTEVVLATQAFSPGVAALADGSFVVTWTQSPYQYEANGRAQRFDANGNAQGAPITLADAFFAYTARPAALAAGGFVAAIDSTTGRYGTNYGALAFYRADGTAAGAPVILNADLNDSATAVFETTASDLGHGRVAAAWVVVAGGTRGLALRLFDAATGQPAAAAVTVASAAHVGAPALATLPDGFALAWEESAGSGRQVVLERFDREGRSLGRRVVATDAAAGAMQPELAALPGGGFALGWRATRYGSTSLEREAFLQRFDAAGAVSGSVQSLGSIQVDLATTNVFNDTLALTPFAGGRVLVLTGDWSAASSWDVKAGVR